MKQTTKNIDKNQLINTMTEEENDIRRILTPILSFVEVITGPGHEVFEEVVESLGRSKVKAFQEKYDWFSQLKGWDPYKKYSFNKQTAEFKEIT